MPRLRDMLTPWRRRRADAGASSIPSPSRVLEAPVSIPTPPQDAPEPAGVTYAKRVKTGHIECRREHVPDGQGFGLQLVRVECLCGAAKECLSDADADQWIHTHAMALNLMRTRRRR